MNPALMLLMRSRAAASWTPASIPGIWGWWDASAITGQANGDPLASWSDLSGNGRTATQSDAAKKPTYLTGLASTNINASMPVVQFDGTADSIATAYQWPGGEATVIAIMRTEATTGYPFYSGKYGAQISGQKQNGFMRLVAALPSSTNTVPLGSFFAGVWRYSDSNNTYSYRKNGTANGSGTTANGSGLGGATGTLGGAVDIGGYLNGYLAEVVTYSASLSDSDCAAVESYLTTKWSLT